MYWLGAVLAKYAGHAGHVRQTSADARQRTLTLPDILSGRFQYMKNVRQGRQELPDIFADHELKKCPAGDQNVRQSIEGKCPADLK